MSGARLPVVLLSALAFAAGGCGGGGDGDSASGTKPDKWASTVCVALDDWANKLQTGSQDLRSTLADTKDLEAVKAGFIGFLEDAEQSSKTMVEEVRAAGSPAVDEGEALQSEFVAALDKVRQSFSRSVDRAQDLSTSNLESFTDGVEILSDDVQKNLAATGEEFNSLGDKFDAKELDEATDREPACNQFTSSG
jgi:hypothetical protein